MKHLGIHQMKGTAKKQTNRASFIKQQQKPFRKVEDKSRNVNHI